MNLNINKERIKHCFKRLNESINLEKFQKIILDEVSEEQMEENINYMPTISNGCKPKKNNSVLTRKKTNQM